MSERQCVACLGPINYDRQALPVNNAGDIVANDYAGEWGGVPACKLCFDVHAKAGPVGLDAYLSASESLRSSLEDARKALQTIREQTEATLHVIGEGPRK